MIRRISLEESGNHAILLYGPQGAGKSELASILAQMWLCTNPTPAGACGECRTCSSLDRGTCADLLTIAPSGPSRMIMNRDITEPSNKKPDDPVPLLDFFRTPPLRARHKVAILFESDRMNGASCNALLKTLEEPPAFAKMILTTDSVGSLPATILSRCLAVACEVPLEKDLLLSFPEATPEEIRFASGAPGRLRTVLDRKDQYDRLLAFAQKLPTRRASEALVVSEEFSGILESFQKVVPGGARAANAEAIDALALYFAREPSCPQGWTQRMIEAHRRIVANGSAGLVLDAMFTALLTR